MIIHYYIIDCTIPRRTFRVPKKAQTPHKSNNETTSCMSFDQEEEQLYPSFLPVWWDTSASMHLKWLVGCVPVHLCNVNLELRRKRKVWWIDYILPHQMFLFFLLMHSSTLRPCLGGEDRIASIHCNCASVEITSSHIQPQIRRDGVVFDLFTWMRTYWKLTYHIRYFLKSE